MLRYKKMDVIGLGLDGLHLFFVLKSWYQEGEALFAQTANALAMEKPASEQGILLGRCLAMQAHLLNLLYVEVGELRTREQVELLCQQSLATLDELQARAESGQTPLILGGYYLGIGKATLSTSTFEQALTVLTPQGNALWLRRVLHDSGFAHYSLGNYDTALHYFQRCTAHCEECGDLKTLGDALNMLGEIYKVWGEYKAARQTTQAAFAARTTAGDKRGIAWSLQLLGEIAWHTGDYATAQQRAQESLALFTEIGTTRQRSAALNTLGNIAYSQGDYAAARRYFRVVLAAHVEVHQLILSWQGVVALTGVGAVLGKEGQHRQAVEPLTHALRHPAGMQETKEHVIVLLTQLAPLVPAEEFAASQQRAETQDLFTVVTELLAETPVRYDEAA